MWRGVTRLLPASQQDERRFVELGFPRDRVVVTGNIKLDVRITPLTDAAKSKLRRDLGLIVHQAVREHPGFTATARADDGTVEAMELPGSRFCVAVQWHPETAADDIVAWLMSFSAAVPAPSTQASGMWTAWASAPPSPATGRASTGSSAPGTPTDSM